MAFTTERLKENGLSLIRLKDTITGAIVDVLPDHGALLHRFEIPVDGKPCNIIDNYPDEATLNNELSKSFKSAKLSPFVCRIKRARYEWLGNSFEFADKFPDGSAIHGLLYNKPFVLTDLFADEQQGSARLRFHYKKNDPAYPYEYTCEVVYRLQAGNLLQLETTILNLSDDPIPLADGWHPYFRLGEKIDHNTIQFNAVSMLAFDEALVPTGELLPNNDYLEPRKLGATELDNCFILQPSDGNPCCTLSNEAGNLHLQIFTNTEYPFLQIFTPPHRNSIAIENLSGAPDCFNNGLGIKIIEPRHSVTFNTWYKIQTGKIS